MPEVILFLPCLIPSVDAVTNRLSAIFICDAIQPIALTNLQEADLPPQFRDAHFVLPPFGVIAVWRRSDGEVHRSFEQHVTVTLQDETEYRLTPDQPFDIAAYVHRVFQQSGPILGHQSGFIILSLKVRRQGDEEWTTAARFPIYVEDIPAAPTGGNPQTEQPVLQPPSQP